MELQNAVRGRRSVRIFRKGPVPRDAIMKIVEAGTLAPSASNRQHWEFVVLTKDSEKKRIHKEVGIQNTILDAPVAIVVFYEARMNSEHMANVQSVSAAVQNMLLRAYELGYGTLWMCSFGDSGKLKEILDVPDYLEPMCIVLLGRPAEAPKMPTRKAIGDVLHFGRYRGREMPLPETIRSSKWTMEEIRENQRLSSRAKHPEEEREIYHEKEVERIQEVIRENMPDKGSRILSLFSYDGTALKKIFRVFSGMKLIDCELTKEACEIVESKLNISGKDVQFVVFGKGTGLVRSSIDMAVMLFSMEKIPEHEMVLKEVRRVLKPGGKLLVFFKNSHSPFGVMYSAVEKLLGLKGMKGFFFSPDPFEPISARKVKRLLRESHFEADMKPLLLMPNETLIYEKKMDNYIKRHVKGKKARLAKAGIKSVNFFVKRFENTKTPFMSSSVCAVAKKV